MTGSFDAEIALDADQIRECLEDLAQRLQEGGGASVVTIAIAGGSCLALMGLRDSTVDVDAVADMRRLWPLCSYADADDVVAAFYDAYPDEERDAFLADHVRSVLGLQR